MKQRITSSFLLITVLLAVGIALAMKATIFQQDSAPSDTRSAVPKAFADYWFAGKAELSSYRLQQAQYGVLNPGTAVLIFVTEDFRTDTQVKAESEASREKAVPVMKTNMVRRFTTGIYDYATFTSVFTPIDNPRFPATLKVSTSVQEWCGHSYIQLNLRNNAYQVAGRSYFEGEATEDYRVDKLLLEDELWNRLRLDPAKIPTGTVNLVPGTVSGRLRHKKLDPLPATVTMGAYAGTAFTGAGLRSCTVDYTTDGRKLMIVFEEAFPHRIMGWEETYKSKDKLLTSRAVRMNTVVSDYWSHNTPADTTLRNELNL